MSIRDTAEKAIEKSRQIILDYYNKEFNLKHKVGRDIVTQADLDSEKAIIDQIKKDFPDHRILSEECGDKKEVSDYMWIIDPIDGTMNFAKGMEEYCISIGVEHKGELVFGIIHKPKTNQTYFAEKGKGAFLDGKQIKVSHETEYKDMTLGTDCSHVDEVQKENFEKLTNMCTDFRTIRIMGSTALHLARLAEGHLDLYYKNRFHYWDFAAGTLILQEAGGKITDFDGNPINKDSKNAVATNGINHEKFLELVNRD